MTKRKYKALYTISVEEGLEVIHVEIEGRDDFPGYIPNSLESMPTFVAEEIACMDDIEVSDVEVTFTKVDQLQSA